MSFIRWNNSFRIGVEEIDNQHQSLLGIINDLVDSVEKGEDDDILGEIIGRLFDYTLLHFNTEERIFALINFPDAEHHKQEHAEFIEKISQFKDDFLDDRLDLPLGMINFLCNWLQNHIKKNDMKIGEYMNNNGLTY